jgi:hypothetical protein
VDGVQIVVAVDDRAERTAPQDVGGEVPVGDFGVAGVPAGLQLGGQRGGGLLGFPELRPAIAAIIDDLDRWLASGPPPQSAAQAPNQP